LVVIVQNGEGDEGDVEKEEGNENGDVVGRE